MPAGPVPKTLMERNVGTLDTRHGDLPSPPSRRADVMHLDSGDHYKLTNNASIDLPFPLKWAKIDHTPEPGQTRIVPFDVISLYFGDPRSRPGMNQTYMDSTGEGFIPSREEENQRLSVRYGVYEQGMEDIIGRAQQEGLAVPDVTVATLDDREIVPPLYDPKGEFSYAFTPTSLRSNDPATIMHNLQTQIERLQGQIEEIQDGPNDGQDVIADEPINPLKDR